MSEHLDSDFTEHSEFPDQPEFKERTGTEPHNPHIHLSGKRRDRVFYIGIIIAAICILGTFSVTSFIAGFVAATTLNKNANENVAGLKKRMVDKQMGNGEQQAKSEIAAKVVILENENGFQFNQQVIKTPPYRGIVWINMTNQIQTITAVNSGPQIKIASGEVNTMFIKEENTVYVLHLNSNSNARITIYVGNSN